MKQHSVLAMVAAMALAACATNPTGGASGNQTLEGSWRLTEVAAQTVGVADSGAKLLQFEAGSNKFSGNVGCNRMFGLYESQGSQLRFSGVATTRMACDPVTMQVEQKVVQSMNQVQSWHIAGKELQLKDDKQQTVLKFQRM